MKAVAIFLAAGLAACGGSDDPCKGVTGTCVAIHDGAGVQEIQTALIQATPGTTIAFAAGTYDLDLDLSLTIDNVTLMGEGMDKSILSFKHQTTGAQGLMVTSANGFAMHD